MFGRLACPGHGMDRSRGSVSNWRCPPFRRDLHGLAPVLAVIMLIAVVVLLFVGVSVMIFLFVGDQPKSAPAIAFQPDELEDRWLVVTAPPQLAWSAYDMRVLGNEGTVKVRLNADAGSVGLSLRGVPTALPASSFPGDLVGGQFLDFCAALEERDVRVLLVHRESEAISEQTTFRDLPADPECV